MLRISKLADYATVIMAYCAQQAHNSLNAKEIAQATAITSPTVSKVLKILHSAELLLSSRGAQGGYRLARPAEKISMLEIVTAVDGAIALTDCNKLHKPCELELACTTRHGWQVINQAIFSALNRITLADIVKPNVQLEVNIPVPQFTKKFPRVSR